MDENSSSNRTNSLTTGITLANGNSNLEEYRFLIEEVNSPFYDKLNSQYPDLSPNERKICVYLKLNMSSREISKFTSQTDEALKKARFRLRQKLGIKRGENLVAFLQKI
jgi:DNA-binding CsgD family transcriptional regulator